MKILLLIILNILISEWPVVTVAKVARTLLSPVVWLVVIFFLKKNSDAITLHLKIFTIKVDESQAHFREVPQYYSFDLTGEVLQYKSMSQLFS